MSVRSGKTNPRSRSVSVFDPLLAWTLLILLFSVNQAGASSPEPHQVRNYAEALGSPTEQGTRAAAEDAAHENKAPNSFEAVPAIGNLGTADADPAATGLVVSPATGVFGNVAVGTTSPVITFTATNNSSSGVSYLGSVGLSEFSIQPGTCHIVNGDPILGPGQTCAFTVAFAPTKSGPVHGVLSIKTASGVVGIPINGIGRGLVVTPSGGSFGDIPIGTTSPEIRFTATNYTSSSVHYQGDQGLDQFVVRSGTCRLAVGEVMLDAGGTCAFTAAFRPTAPGPATGEILIETSEGTVTVPFTGSGSALVFTPPVASFGDVRVGTTSPKISITAKNYTNGPAVLLSASGSDRFKTQPGSCGAAHGAPMLAAGATCTFYAEFSPAVVGSVSGQLNIRTALGPVTYQLSGTGIGTAEGPVANPGGPYTGASGAAITFDGSRSTAPTGQTLTYSWSFGDGGAATGVSPVHTYTTGGRYTVSLTVTGSAGGTSTAGTTATITQPIPLAANAGGPYTGGTAVPVTFDGSRSTVPAGQTLSYSWNFGDGGTATGVGPVHTYTVAGGYTVSLTVTASGGGTNTATTTATINQTIPLKADAGGPYTGATGISLTFDGSRSTAPAGQTLSYAWNFGDGTSGTGVNPVHSYTARGSYNIVLTVTDTAGASSVSSTTAQISLGPNPLSIRPVISPAPNAAHWNNTPVTVSFVCASTGPAVTSCPASQTISTDAVNKVITGTVTDAVGDMATASVTINLERIPPVLGITAPGDNSTITLSTTAISISGTVSSPVASITSLTCGGIVALVSGTTFTCNATLTSGANAIAIVATDIAGNTSTIPLHLNYVVAPALSITSPVNLSVTNLSPVTINGTVNDPLATVTVDGVAVPQSGGAFSSAVPLVEGLNILTAVATNAAGIATTATLEVTLDTTPPHVLINTPPDGSLLTASSVTVSGLANDVVVGTVNLQDLQVSVNGVAAQVANRSFSALGVPLALGVNTIRATGTDRAGNGASTSVTVTRVLPSQPPTPAIGGAVLTQWVNVLSGDTQTGVVGTALSAPVVVSLTDAASHPVVNQVVVFKVTANNGLVSSGSEAASSAIAVTTDASGKAQVNWTLGQRAGAGINVLQISSALAVSPATVTATGTTGPSALVVVDSGNNQTGVLGQPLPFPFVVDVVDAGHNRVPGVPVVFTVKQGGGSLSGAATKTITSDSNGRAIVILTEGLTAGTGNNIVEASFAGNTALPAAFVASAKVPGNPSGTTISGVVLDNSNLPIENVTIRLYKTNQGSGNNLPVQVGTSVVTDAHGAFAIAPAPVGAFKLMADGTTAAGTTSFPTLEYDIVTVAGNDNTVGMPIYLPALDTVNKVCVDETHGGTLTLPQYPGFALKIAAGSATFPGGSRTGCVSATPVNGDKVPMAPGFGQQPRFIVTIQPVGTIFNPPAPLTLPNVDGLKAKAVTEMYSYDHDLSMFVAIGTGTVTADGSQIVSDTGVGVVKAGWHCGGDPATAGTVADCPVCKICDGTSCVADASQDLKVCMTSSTPLGACMTGTCTPITATVSTVTFSGAQFHNVSMDTGTPYGSPQWTSSAIQYPVSYTAGSTISLMATFQLSAAASGATVQVTGTAASGLVFQGSGTISGSTVTLPVTAGSQPLNNSISQINPLTIHWTLNINGTNVDAGSSSNKVYVTLNDPTSAVLYETLLDIGTRSASGATATAAAVSSIWSAFTSRSVARVDGVVMGYWTGGANTCQSLPDMLSAPGGDGSCVAWAQLFHQTLEAEGISGSQVFMITVDTTLSPGGDGFLVKNWMFGKHLSTGADGLCNSHTSGDDVLVLITTPMPNFPCITPGPNGVLDSAALGDDQVVDGVNFGTPYPYILYSGTSLGMAYGNPYGDVANQPGIPGQNNAEPPPFFYNHFIVEYLGSVYDPSYGAGPFASELAHKNAASDGIKSGNEAKKNSPAVQTLVYQRVPSLE